MDRRDFLKSTGGATATAATLGTAAAASGDVAVAAPALSAGRREVRLAMAWPDGVAGFADQAYRLARRIEAGSGGRFRIAILPGIADGIAAIRNGEADLYHGSDHSHLAACRALAYFAGLPGASALAQPEHEAWLLVGGGQVLWDQLAADFGVKPLLCGQALTTCVYRSQSLVPNAKGPPVARIATVGLASELARSAGLETIAVPIDRLAEALDDGSVDAVEWAGGLAGQALGLPHRARSIGRSPFHRTGLSATLGIARKLWDGLTPSDRLMIEHAAAAEYRLSGAEDRAYGHHLADTDGPADDLGQSRGRLERLAAALIAELASGDPAAQRVNLSYMAFARHLRGGPAHGAYF